MWGFSTVSIFKKSFRLLQCQVNGPPSVPVQVQKTYRNISGLQPSMLKLLFLEPGNGDTRQFMETTMRVSQDLLLRSALLRRLSPHLFNEGILSPAQRSLCSFYSAENSKFMVQKEAVPQGVKVSKNHKLPHKPALHLLRTNQKAKYSSIGYLEP